MRFNLIIILECMCLSFSVSSSQTFLTTTHVFIYLCLKKLITLSAAEGPLLTVAAQVLLNMSQTLEQLATFSTFVVLSLDMHIHVFFKNVTRSETSATLQALMGTITYSEIEV